MSTLGRPPSWAVLAAAGLVLAGCGQDPRPAVGADAPVRSTVRVGLTEWEITTPPAVLAAGTVTFQVTNAGSAPHDLAVEGRLGSWETPLLAPGEGIELVVETAPGEELHLDCTVPGHHSAGMHTSFQVTPTTRSPGGGDDG